MTTNERTAPCQEMPSQQQEVQPHAAANSIPGKDELRKMPPVKRLRVQKGLADDQIIDQVTGLYPYFNVLALHYAENAEEYGLDLRDDAMNALYAAFAPELAPKKPRRERRKLTRRIQGRLSESDYRALQEYIKRLGYQTMQDWLAVTVRRALAASRWNKKEGDADEHL